MATVASTLANTLYHAGIDTVFGLPGGETVEFLEALRLQGIRFILAHHETSAIFMADGWARATGRPGACLTTLGPGAANAVAGVAHAHLDRAPILVITAQKPDALLPDYTHQVLDLRALFRPITKASVRLDAHNVVSGTCDALALAVSGRPGPVHLQLSNEDAAVRLPDEPRLPLTVPARAPATVVSEGDLYRARSLLSAAHKPLILAGLGLEPERPYVVLRQLAELAQAPVVVTPKAKGALPDNHPLSAGTIGLTRDDPAYSLLDEADLILAVGFDVVELVRPWSHPAPLIWVAPWDNRDPSLVASLEIVGGLTPALQLLTAIPFHTAANWGSSRVAAFRAAHGSPPAPVEPAPGCLSPQLMLAALRRQVPPDAYLAVDVGSHKIFASLAWAAYAPNRFLVSNGLSCMGYALPAAIGAALAGPGTPAIALTGDGGLAMNLGELAVLARCSAPVTAVVLNDGALDLIRSHQRRAGKAVFGTEFRPPDFCAVARAFGLAAYRAENEVQLAEALSRQLCDGRPGLIEIMLDPSGYPTTPR